VTENTKASPLASAARAFYVAHSIPDEAKNELEDTAAFLIGVTRRSTAEAFERGKYLEKAAALLPEGTLEKWAVECCGYTARHVRTQRAIHRNLAYCKAILVELAVGPTVLGKLSAATPEQIEQAIGHAGNHGRLRVQDVTAIMAGPKQDNDEKAEVDPYDVGGPDGLKAIIAVKMRDGMKSFVGHIEEIRTHVLEALPKNNIVKKDLAAKTHLTARLANRELESLVQFVRPHPNDRHTMTSTELPKKSGWEKVSRLLYQMGSETSWPDKDKLRTWLESEVVPTLEWATSKSGSPAWPDKEADNVANAKSMDQVAVDKVSSRDDAAHGKVAASFEERMQSIAAVFGATATVELPNAIPTVEEALAQPQTEKRFKRPEYVKKVKPTSPPSAAA
jgi:hypothetical protein